MWEAKDLNLVSLSRIGANQRLNDGLCSCDRCVLSSYRMHDYASRVLNGKVQGLLETMGANELCSFLSTASAVDLTNCLGWGWECSLVIFCIGVEPRIQGLIVLCPLYVQMSCN